MAFVDDAAWQQADWKWDSRNMKASPAQEKPSKGGKAAQKSPASVEGVKQGCQVEGCAAEVGGMRDYHSRYKICEFHLKANVVHREGRAHRFCQQCGKFQPLEDFDGEKRSCRARLDKHNARRRRQREMAHMLKKTGTVDERLLAEKYGLSGEEIAPKLARMAKQGFAVKPSRSGTASGAVTVTLTGTGTQPLSGSPSGSGQPTGEGGTTATSAGVGTATSSALDAAVSAQAAQHAAALLQQLQAQQQAQAQQAAVTPLQAQLQALLDGAAAVPAAASHPDAQSMVLDDEFLEEVFNPMLAQGAVPAVQQQAQASAFMQLDPSSTMHLDDLAGLEQLTKEIIAAAAARPAAPPAPRAPLMGGPGGSWPTAPLNAAAPPTASLGSNPHTPSTSDTAMGALPPYLAAAAGHAAAVAPFPGLLLGVPPFGGGLQPPPPLPGAMRLDLGQGGRVESPGSVHSTGTAADLAGQPMLRGTVLEDALNLLNYDSTQITYVPEDKLVRFSAKLFNCTPAQLPSDLKASLVNMLSCQSMEGYLRQGCVHLTVNAMLGPEERDMLASRGVRAVVERLVAQQPNAFWSEHPMLIQLGDKLVLVREGRVVHVLATAHSSIFPRVAALRPLAAAPDAEGGLEVSVWGHNLGNEEDSVLARCKGAYVDVERLRLVSDPAWHGLQRLDLRLAGVQDCGAVQVEVMRGGYISASKAMLVTRDASLISEVRSLEAEMGTDSEVDTLLFQLAACEEWHAGGARDYSAADKEVLGRSSRRLLAFAVQRKWVAATRALLATVSVDQPLAEAMAAVDVMCVGATGMPLLQLAVRSGRLELVRSLLDWGEEHGHVFRSTTPGRRGLTALHLAALLPDKGVIALLLTEKCADAPSGWESAAAEDGSLPIDFAHHAGTSSALNLFLAARQLQAAQAAHSKAASAACGCPCEEDAAAPAAGTTVAAGKAALPNGKLPINDSASSSRIGAKALGAEGAGCGSEHDGEDGVTAVKAKLKALRTEQRAQDALLRFRNPPLEARYQAWHSAGQVPVDVSFLAIAILSQGAWIFRWSAAASWLGVAMVALMAMNAAMLQMAVLFPSAYARCRSALCMWSHGAHKLAQAAVTLVPPVGTVFSPTYNPTVALLESSSLAQVHMLSFGMKLRFADHLCVALFHVASAMAGNEAICAAGFPSVRADTCVALLSVWELLTCFALPCALVYMSEKRARRIFLETVAD